MALKVQRPVNGKTMGERRRSFASEDGDDDRVHDHAMEPFPELVRLLGGQPQRRDGAVAFDLASARPLVVEESPDEVLDEIKNEAGDLTQQVIHLLHGGHSHEQRLKTPSQTQQHALS